jgi:hypothetical protein
VIGDGMFHTRRKKKEEEEAEKKEWNERDRKKGRPLFLLGFKCDVFCAAGGLGGCTVQPNSCV